MRRYKGEEQMRVVQRDWQAEATGSPRPSYPVSADKWPRILVSRFSICFISA